MRIDSVELTILSERIYRSFLEVIKHELDLNRKRDINAIQAFILLNIDNNKVTMSEITSRGYYIGSNASYNIKKMIINDYINQKQSEYDKRSTYISITSKGKELIDNLNTQLTKYSKEIEVRHKICFKRLINTLRNIDSFWKLLSSHN